MPNSMIDRKFILWRTTFDPQNEAYHDQFGLTHPGWPILEEIAATVVSDDSEKIKVRSSDGREFQAMKTPNGLFWGYNGTMGNNLRVDDACVAYNRKVRYPFVGPGETRLFPTGAQKCIAHDQAYMEDDPIGCWDCYLERQNVARAATTTA